MTHKFIRFALALTAVGVATACIKLPNSKPNRPEKPEEPEPAPSEAYIYPFGEEPRNITAELTLSLVQGGGQA